MTRSTKPAGSEEVTVLGDVVRRGGAGEPPACILLDIERLTVRFKVRHRRQAHSLTAVDNLSLAVRAGESLGVVGESGCGKSTLARAILGLVSIAGGVIRFHGDPVARHRPRQIARRIQMVFQDPTSSLNPRLKVSRVLREILRVHEVVPESQMQPRLEQLMEMVGLTPSVLDRRPGALSGGQRQRVGIARALAPEPELLLLDEAVAALDVSVQATVLELLHRLQRELGLTMLFISHDLAVVRSICDRVVVMYLGRIVEIGDAEEVFRRPRHPYTRALLAAAPRVDVRRRPGTAAPIGEPPSPIDPPSGCRFRTRCPIAQPVCAEQSPQLTAEDHGVACFFPLDPPTSDEPGVIAHLEVPT